MGLGISVEKLFDLFHSRAIFGLVAQNMGFRKVEKLGHCVLTSFCALVRSRFLQTAALRPAVVFRMGEQMANVDASQIIAHIDDKAIFAPSNIENRTPLPEETCRGKISAN